MEAIKDVSGTGNILKRGRRIAAAVMTAWMAVLPLMVYGQGSGPTITKADFAFTNVVDNTLGFTLPGSMPAINNAGAVAFESAGTGFELGGVWKWQNGSLTTIATSADKILGLFGETVAINSAGRVGFTVKVLSPIDTIIATGDGGALNTIVSATDQGLVGGGALGISAINDSGAVAFLGIRKGFTSRAIFVGRGGPLTPVVDTATNPNFLGFGNADIDASGRVAFLGFPADGSEGIFLISGGIKDIVDTNNPNVADFLDPVINDSGTVGGGIFLTSGGGVAFTGNAAGVIPRSDPTGSAFAFVDNVSINNRGDVAFFGAKSEGGEGIFTERTGGSNEVPVIETGDSLFGSTVVGLTMGRFSLNDGGQIAFRYQLADRRSGIAVATARH